jgi:hypothetical protein
MEQLISGDPKHKFKVGDLVQLTFMSETVRGRVVEDRGTIGVGGRRLYRIVIRAGNVNRVMELPADRLVAVQP